MPPRKRRALGVIPEWLRSKAVRVRGARHRRVQWSADVEHIEQRNMIYTCPMHPEVRKDRPGKCPKCGVDLVPAGTTPHSGGRRPTDGRLKQVSRAARRNVR